MLDEGVSTANLPLLPCINCISQCQHICPSMKEIIGKCINFIESETFNRYTRNVSIEIFQFRNTLMMSYKFVVQEKRKRCIAQSENSVVGVVCYLRTLETYALHANSTTQDTTTDTCIANILRWLEIYRIMSFI